MRRIIVGGTLALLLAAPAAATDYKLEFSQGDGTVLKGRGGLQVVDVRTDKTLMRVIAPGSRITKRGAVRVLVMNLGQPAFEFGPDQVSVELPNGTLLAEVPVAVFDKGEKLVEKEVAIGRSVDRAVKANLSAYADAQNSGGTAASVTGGTLSREDVGDNALKMDELSDQLPGAKLLGGLNGVLRPLAVGPKEAWGGFLIFDMPKALQKAKDDQPVTIVVRTGREVHRIKALLNRV
ncbi:MAG: hypothetical protein ABIO43_07220 [Sphingomicrobium sp.]